MQAGVDQSRVFEKSDNAIAKNILRLLLSIYQHDPAERAALFIRSFLRVGLCLCSHSSRSK